MSRIARHLILLMLIIVVFMVMFQSYKNTQPTTEIKWSEFLQKVESNQVQEVAVNGREIKGTYSNPPGGKFKTWMPSEDTSGVLFGAKGLLTDHKVAIKSEQPEETPWWLWVVQALPYVLLFGFFYFMLRSAQSGTGQAFSFGRSRAKMHSEDKIRVTFDDVAGVDEAKEELQEIVDYLKNPKKYQALGARIPKGVLLLGAPGTGKTLLGRAIAGEAGKPFYYISGSDFVEMFVGVGASRVRDLFEQAKKTAPCIVFVDEIDAVGRQRGAGLGGGHDEREQTLNQLLVEMDGFENNSGVIMLAATNRPDVLDPALLRPGRFDRHIVVDKPDIIGRTAILQIHSRNKSLAPDVDLATLAKRTPGFTGADLENLLNEAALLAARRDKDKVEMEDCEESIDRVLMGPERRSRLINEKEKEITAYHEGGHALVARKLPDANPVRKVTILPRGMALGVTWQMPEEDKYLRTKEELLAMITVAMGGRVAEELVFGKITTGAANDLEHATAMARDMVTKYGMSAVLGPLTFGHKHEQVFLGRDLFEERNYSDEIASKIDAEVRQIADECYQEARRIINENMDSLHALVKVLREREVLEGEELDKVLAGETLPPFTKPNVPAAKPPSPAPSQERGRTAEGPAPGGLTPEPSPS